MPAMAANEPENLTADWSETSVILDWDDVAGATQYNISQYLPAMIFTATPPTLDGLIDQVYVDESHKFMEFSPNPAYPNATDVFYLLRNDTYVYLAADTTDGDIENDDDVFRVYVDFNRDGLTNNEDQSYSIAENGDLMRYKWTGSAWTLQANAGAMGAVTGAGTANPIYELFIPMSELNGFIGETTHDILYQRSSTVPGEPTIILYNPPFGIPTDTAEWLTINITTAPGQYYFTGMTTTQSNITITDLDTLSWYIFGASSLVSGVPSNNTLISGTTEKNRWCAIGNVYDEATGEPIRNGLVCACYEGTTEAISITNVSGYYELCGLYEVPYTLTATKLGYDSVSIGVIIPEADIETDILMSTFGNNSIPLTLFIFLAVIDIVCIGFSFVSFDRTSITQIFGSFMATIISFMLSKMAVNGQLVESFEFASVIQNAAIGYLFQYIAIIMVIITLLRAALYVLERYQESEF